MNKEKMKNKDIFFQNAPEHFSAFKGKLISTAEIKQTDFTDKKVGIIGANQLSVTHLDLICDQAEFVKVFQISPHFVLPHTEKGIQKLISHPLLVKNRRLFNNRIKSLVAIRYLESQVNDVWLRRQLMPNSAASKKVYLKSDTYYAALQRDNCKLITWPVVKITDDAIQSMEGIEHLVDIIITTHDL